MEELKNRPGFFLGVSNNGHFIYNSEKNLFYEVDEIFYQVLKHLSDYVDEADIIKKLSEKYSKDKVIESLREVSIQLQGGVLKQERIFLEEGYYLDIDVPSFPGHIDKVIEYINYFPSCKFFHINFINTNNFTDYNSINDWIDEISSIVAGTPRIISYYLITKSDTINPDSIQDLNNNMINLVIIVEDNTMDSGLRKIVKNSGIGLLINNWEPNWKQFITDCFNLNDNSFLYFNINGMLVDLIKMETEGLSQKIITLKNSLSQINQLFINLSSNLKKIIRIEPFYSGFHLLQGQLFKRFHCWAGRRKLYLNKGKLYPCQRLCRESEQLNSEESLLCNFKQIQWYISDLEQKPCLNCWAKSFCGGFCRALSEYDHYHNYYCDIQKYLAQLHINNYQKLTKVFYSESFSEQNKL